MAIFRFFDSLRSLRMTDCRGAQSARRLQHNVGIAPCVPEKKMIPGTVFWCRGFFGRKAGSALYFFVSRTFTPCMMISPASTAISSGLSFMPVSIQRSASARFPAMMNEQK